MSTPVTSDATLGKSPSAQSGLSEGERLLDTFSAPSKTFRDINVNGRWWVPFVIISVISYLFVFTVDKKVGFTVVAQNQLKMSPKAQERLEKLPPEQQQRQMDLSASITKGISFAYPVLFLIIALIVSGVLLAVFNFGMGAEITFGKMLAVSMYAFLPGIGKALLAVLTLFAGLNAESFTFQNPVGTNIGYYLSFADTPRFLYSLASSLDVFAIWSTILIGLGVSCISKVERTTAVVTTFACWAFWILISAGLGALFA